MIPDSCGPVLRRFPDAAITVAHRAAPEHLKVARIVHRVGRGLPTVT
jgi:hypothetical protein